MILKMNKPLDWIESARWIRDNEKSITTKEHLIFDFSNVRCIQSSVIGSIIDTMNVRSKYGLTTEIIRPNSPLMKIIFDEIGVK